MNVKRKPKTLSLIALIIRIAALHPASVFAQIPTPQIGEYNEFMLTTAWDEWIQAVIREYPFYLIITDWSQMDALAATAAEIKGMVDA